MDWSRFRAIHPDVPESPIYRNSVQGKCEDCGDDIWIGPRIAEAKATYPKAPLVCFLCSVDHFDPSTGVHAEVINLGNTDTL